MKKIVTLIAVCALMLCGLCACGNAKGSTTGATSAADTEAGSTGGKKIVTTIFPEYDWVKNLLGSNPAGFELIMLLDNGADLHSFQPTAEDIMTISTCDMFVYVGGESDKWVDDALQEATNKDMVVIDLLDVLGDSVKEEEEVEGMEEHDHDHDHEDADEDHDHDHEEIEYDEHVWLSLKNASKLCDAITDGLKKIDSANASAYDENLKSYKDKLSALDAEYEKAVNAGSIKTLLFADRFPFRYMVDDYGLSYYAAFSGCSAESEASFETIAFLAEKTDELGLKVILTIEGTDKRVADTVSKSTKSKDQQILAMDSMQSKTKAEVESGTTYLSVMESNLEVLKQAVQ